MRFCIEYELNREEIYKDKNKLFVSWLKNFMKKYDEDMYKHLYEAGSVEKDYTFSIYLGSGAVFKLETIELKTKFVKMFFSCYETENSIRFYNIFNSALNKNYSYKDLEIKAINISLLRDERFTDEYAYFKTKSPLIVREHNKNNNKSYYWNISTKEGQKILLRNLIERLTEKFGDQVKDDLKTFSIEVLSNKSVTVRHNRLNIPSNLSVIKIVAKSYILDYIYSTGKLSAFNGSGYGMLERINDERITF